MVRTALSKLYPFVEGVMRNVSGLSTWSHDALRIPHNTNLKFSREQVITQIQRQITPIASAGVVSGVIVV